MVASSARCQLNRKMNISLSPLVPENLVPRDTFGRPVPRQPAHYPHPGAESSAYSRALLLPPDFPDINYDDKGLYAPLSIPSIAIGSDHVPQMRTSADTGIVVLQITRITGASYWRTSNPWINQCSSPLFPHLPHCIFLYYTVISTNHNLVQRGFSWHAL